ncbi:tyrosine-type recombinase/integrase [Sebaldella sp. S0638]|uniref:tyrosine-type recombinase/integrase n=1 Tax=Sebaldella sp. S0638 TaxID=2957809 RepID=UPI0020A15355|nr:tyrosine-type recombinase/integrase [Sebaldella sp. S0638]MCP1224499.1 tyrosine-type recombinase/integrase [Sebaldella sp. S0638]
MENRTIILEFLDYLRYEKGNSENTLSSYNRDLNLFFSDVPKLFQDVEDEDIIEYVDKLSKTVKRNTVLRKIASIRTFYKFCYMNKYINDNPTESLKNLKREFKLPEVLRLNEIKDIIDAIPNTPEGVRDKLIIKILVATGARISEVLSLEIKDVENQDYEFIRVLGKGSKYRLIPIYSQLEDEIKDYIENDRKILVQEKKEKEAENSNKDNKSKKKSHELEYKLFLGTRRENFWKRLKRYAQNAKIEKNVYPHIFRHSVATMLINNGADIRIVQEILGHVNISTTEIYTHVGKRELKEIYNKVKIGDEE